jgi:hypothetical protein
MEEKPTSAPFGDDTFGTTQAPAADDAATWVLAEIT